MAFVNRGNLNPNLNIYPLPITKSMLSRVADSFYWMNRYIERAENVARFVDVNLNLMLDLPSSTPQQWQPLVMTTGDLPLFESRYGEMNPDNAIQFLAFDENYPNSIVSCIRRARENARSIREIISSEMWEEINLFYMMLQEAEKSHTFATLPNLFSEIKQASHRFAGVMNATMSHNEGWHFGQMGRLLERGDKTARILDVKYFFLLPSLDWVGTPLDQLQWIALLKSASAYEMYRKCQHRITPSCVAEFLILDREFPRSIYFCLMQAEFSLCQIAGTTPGTWRNSAERALGRTCAELGYLTIEEITELGLHEFLDGMQHKINDIGDKVSTTFFGIEPSSTIEQVQMASAR